MQKFLTDTLQSRFIKALLYTTYICQYKAVRKYDIIISGIKYLYNSNIILCTRTGRIEEDAQYSVVTHYNNITVNRQIASNYLSQERYYDSDTHDRLGEYLRYYRGTKNIDLMPLYNCFNNSYNSSYIITDTGLSPRLNNSSKVLQVPIKFNTTYTIAIDCASKVMIAPAFIKDEDYLFSGDINLTDELLFDQSLIKNYPSLSFNNPITYEVSNIYPKFQKYEKHLKLLIQIPYRCDSSCVVLEGNYTNISAHNTINTQVVDFYDVKYLLPESRIKGDVDGDGYITTSDLSLVQQNIAGITYLNELQTWCADVNSDEQVTAADVMILRNFLDDKFNVLSSSNMQDYLGNWIYDYDKKAWTYIISDITNIDNISEFVHKNLISYEIINNNSVKLYFTFPPTATNQYLIIRYKNKIDNSSKTTFNWRHSLTSSEKDNLFISNLSLLRINDRNIYAFSDKLIIYLLHHVIDSREEIYNNIRRVQDIVDIYKYYDSTPDVWDDFLRKVLFDSYTKYNKFNLDTLGYVDNDVENFLSKMKGLK